MFYILTFTIPPFVRSYYFKSMFYTVDVLLPYYVLQSQRLTSRRFAQPRFTVHFFNVYALQSPCSVLSPRFMGQRLYEFPFYDSMF